MVESGEKMKFVASFTDAWIETPLGIKLQHPDTVASFTDAWIETFVLKHTLPKG